MPIGCIQISSACAASRYWSWLNASPTAMTLRPVARKASSSFAMSRILVTPAPSIASVASTIIAMRLSSFAWRTASTMSFSSVSRWPSSPLLSSSASGSTKLSCSTTAPEGSSTSAPPSGTVGSPSEVSTASNTSSISRNTRFASETRNQPTNDHSAPNRRRTGPLRFSSIACISPQAPWPASSRCRQRE